MQLQQKRVQIDDVCSVCRQEAETTTHILLQCSFAASCWSIYYSTTTNNEEWDFTEWFVHYLLSKSMEERDSMVTLCWAIWRSRNDVIWQQKYSNPTRVVANTREYLLQWRKTQNRFYNVPLQLLIQGDGAEAWVRPQ